MLLTAPPGLNECVTHRVQELVKVGLPERSTATVDRRAGLSPARTVAVHELQCSAVSPHAQCPMPVMLSTTSSGGTSPLQSWAQRGRHVKVSDRSNSPSQIKGLHSLPISLYLSRSVSPAQARLFNDSNQRPPGLIPLGSKAGPIGSTDSLSNITNVSEKKPSEYTEKEKEEKLSGGQEHQLPNGKSEFESESGSSNSKFSETDHRLDTVPSSNKKAQSERSLIASDQKCKPNHSDQLKGASQRDSKRPPQLVREDIKGRMAINSIGIKSSVAADQTKVDWTSLAAVESLQSELSDWQRRHLELEQQRNAEMQRSQRNAEALADVLLQFDPIKAERDLLRKEKTEISEAFEKLGLKHERETRLTAELKQEVMRLKTLLKESERSQAQSAKQARDNETAIKERDARIAELEPAAQSKADAIHIGFIKEFQGRIKELQHDLDISRGHVSDLESELASWKVAATAAEAKLKLAADEAVQEGAARKALEYQLASLKDGAANAFFLAAEKAAQEEAIHGTLEHRISALKDGTKDFEERVASPENLAAEQAAKKDTKHAAEIQERDELIAVLAKRLRDAESQFLNSTQGGGPQCNVARFSDDPAI